MEVDLRTVSSFSQAQFLLGGVEIDQDNNFALLDKEMASMRQGRAFLAQINDNIPKTLISMETMLTTVQDPRQKSTSRISFDSLVLSMVYAAHFAKSTLERPEDQLAWVLLLCWDTVLASAREDSFFLSFASLAADVLPSLLECCCLLLPPLCCWPLELPALDASPSVGLHRSPAGGSSRFHTRMLTPVVHTGIRIPYLTRQLSCVGIVHVDRPQIPGAHLIIWIASNHYEVVNGMPRGLQTH
ncbi:hypothetical protein N1851_015989 [Merluccius polli]|uniref:Uncharacterized protein n=1 Tax=Merluccius polli TaxID=89951 RepID=A0AA47NZV6_MERPO|nr:hypothetical protein N1851_015989 [Merluccius polli]